MAHELSITGQAMTVVLSLSKGHLTEMEGLGSSSGCMGNLKHDLGKALSLSRPPFSHHENTWTGLDLCRSKFVL